jgi:hypothetical protein
VAPERSRPPSRVTVASKDVVVVVGLLAAIEAALFTGDAPRDLTRLLRRHFVRTSLLHQESSDGQLRLALADLHERLRGALE